jgi:predicted amidohydrolase YtcJ
MSDPVLVSADRVRTATGLIGDALVIEAGRISAIGDAGDLRRSWPSPVREFDGTIVPGLRDAHLHPVGYAAALQRPSLKKARDFEAIADILSDAMQSQPAGSAITALRLDDESLAEQRLPDRSLLDSISASRPILLMRYCGHIAVANTAALELAGIGRDTPDPPGGVIDRDTNGDPTGVLRETAFEPVTAALRPLAPPLTSDDISTALTALTATGLTSVGAMAATDSGLWGGASSELAALLDAGATSALRLGTFVIARTPETLRKAAEQIEGSRGRARFLGVKMFSDGSLGGHTAAMHTGFADLPATTGTDRLDSGWAQAMAEASLEMGGGVAIHAIGDRANGSVLDLMETLLRDGADPARLRIEHASVLTVGDISRFGRLGVTASVQPAFIASETEWLEKRLGADRAGLTYAFRSLIDAGAPLAGGSDCPVEPPHPLLGMAVARDRLGFVAAESLSATEALHLFTEGAATAIGERAQLTVGSPADFTVLDVDPITATPDELRRAQVVSTWVDGAEVQIPSGITTWQG